MIWVEDKNCLECEALSTHEGACRQRAAIKLVPFPSLMGENYPAALCWQHVELARNYPDSR